MTIKTVQTSAGPKQVHLRGWRKQMSDARDEAFRVKLHPALLAAPLPAKLDLRELCLPVEEQGSLGSCTAHMRAALVEFNERARATGAKAAPSAPSSTVVVSNVATSPADVVTFNVAVTPAADPSPAPPSPKKLVHDSRLFGYYGARLLEGSVGDDSGATIRDVIKAGVRFGCVDESLWPYDVSKFKVNPPGNVWNEAKGHIITSYHSINDGDLVSMKSALASNFLVGFGFVVYDAMLGPEVARTGLLTYPTAKESVQGGHAVVLVGWDDALAFPDGSVGGFIVRNSWSSAWGVGGYFFMPYRYVADTRLANDFWIVQSAPL